MAKKTYYEYQNAFNKQKYRRVTAMIPTSETEVIKKLNSVPSMSAYVLALIKADVLRGKNGEILGK